MTSWQTSLVRPNCRIWHELSGNADGDGFDFSQHLIWTREEPGNGHAFHKTSAMQHYQVPMDGL
jgi:hypothetical protein